MVMAKSDRNIYHFYLELIPKGKYHLLSKEILSNYEKTTLNLLKILSRKEWLTKNLVLKRSITVRNPYIDPLHFIQIKAIRLLRDDPNNKIYPHLVISTLNGIAHGMRNTG